MGEFYLSKVILPNGGGTVKVTDSERFTSGEVREFVSLVSERKLMGNFGLSIQIENGEILAIPERALHSCIFIFGNSKVDEEIRSQLSIDDFQDE